MNKDFWEKKWGQNQLGFHLPQGFPLLDQITQNWNPAEGGVILPLCGKSYDLIKLAQRGFHVSGIEIVEEARAQFEQENSQVLKKVSDVNSNPHQYKLKDGPGQITWFHQDIFEMNFQTLSKAAYWFDRAAVVALSFEQRRKYFKIIENVFQGPHPVGIGLQEGIMINLEYEHHEIIGPPFCVALKEIKEALPDLEVIELRSDVRQVPHDHKLFKNGITETIQRVLCLRP